MQKGLNLFPSPSLVVSFFCYKMREVRDYEPCLERGKKKVENLAPSIKLNWILVGSQPLQPLNKKLYKWYVR